MKKGIDYIGVGVGAAIINNEGKLFLALRGKNAKNERGKWEVPGGGVEFGETMQDSIVREMREEFGIDIQIVDRLGLYNHILPEDKQHWVAISFVCKIVNGIPKILEPDKIAEFGWFTLDEALELPLSILGRGDVMELKKKYSAGITRLHAVDL